MILIANKHTRPITILEVRAKEYKEVFKKIKKLYPKSSIAIYYGKNFEEILALHPDLKNHEWVFTISSLVKAYDF